MRGKVGGRKWSPRAFDRTEETETSERIYYRDDICPSRWAGRVEGSQRLALLCIVGQLDPDVHLAELKAPSVSLLPLHFAI